MPGNQVRLTGAWVDLLGDRTALGGWQSGRRVNVASGGGFAPVGVNIDIASRVKLILDACHNRIINATAPQKLSATPTGYPAGGYLGGTYINWRGDWDGINPYYTTNYNVDGTSDASRTPLNPVASTDAGSGHTYSYKVIAQFFDIVEGIPTAATNSVTAGGAAQISYTAPSGVATHYRVLRSIDGAAYLQPAAYTSTATSWPIGTAPNYTPGQTLIDTAASWTNNQWAGYGVILLNNTSFLGRCATIASNTSTTITFTSHFSSSPPAGSAYAIIPLTSSTTYTDNQSYVGVSGALSQAVRHDPTTDITYLRNLLDYQALVGSHSYDDDIATMTPIVYQNFWKYSSYKAWPYFEMIRLHIRQPNQGWGAAAAFTAASIYKNFYDSTSGAIVDKSKTPNSYTVSYALQAAVVLLDAAQRFDGLSVTGLSGSAPTSLTITNAAFAPAGRSAVSYMLTNGATNATTGLLAKALVWNYPSTDTVAPDTSTGELNRSGEGGQDLDYFCRAYQLAPSISGLLTEIRKYAESSLNTYGLYDTVNGGFFQSLEYNGTNLNTAYKEVGRQAHWLRALNRMVVCDPGGSDSHSVSWSTWRNRLLNTAAFRYFSTTPPCSGSSYPGGCVYRLYNNFNLYVDTDTGKAADYTTEHWVTSEACGIVAGALLDQLQRVHTTGN